MSQIRDCENFFHLETALQTFRTTITNLHNGIPDTRRALSGTASWPTSSGSTSFLSFSPGYGDFPAVKNPSLFTSHIQRLEKSTRETNEHTHAPAHTHTNRSGHCGETTKIRPIRNTKQSWSSGRTLTAEPFSDSFLHRTSPKKTERNTRRPETLAISLEKLQFCLLALEQSFGVWFSVAEGMRRAKPRAKIGPWPPIGGKSRGKFFRLFRTACLNERLGFVGKLRHLSLKGLIWAQN